MKKVKWIDKETNTEKEDTLIEIEFKKIPKKQKTIKVTNHKMDALIRNAYTDKKYKKIKDDLKKFKGKGKFYKYDDIISYIEIIRRYENDKRKMKHSLKKAKDFVQSFNNETGKNIKVRTFNSFLDKIDNYYSEISNSFFNDKTNDEILSSLKEKLKEKLHFNDKV